MSWNQQLVKIKYKENQKSTSDGKQKLFKFFNKAGKECCLHVESSSRQQFVIKEKRKPLKIERKATKRQAEMEFIIRFQGTKYYCPTNQKPTKN